MVFGQRTHELALKRKACSQAYLRCDHIGSCTVFELGLQVVLQMPILSTWSTVLVLIASWEVSDLGSFGCPSGSKALPQPQPLPAGVMLVCWVASQSEGPVSRHPVSETPGRKWTRHTCFRGYAMLSPMSHEGSWGRGRAFKDDPVFAVRIRQRTFQERNSLH